MTEVIHTAQVQSVEWTGQAQGSKVNVLRSTSSISSNHNWMGSSHKLPPWSMRDVRHQPTSQLPQPPPMRCKHLVCDNQTFSPWKRCYIETATFCMFKGGIAKTPLDRRSQFVCCLNLTVLSQQPVSSVWASVWFHCKLCTFSLWPPKLLTTVWVVANGYF